MLMEHETSKLKELEESYARELKEWKADLKPRKQVSLYHQFKIKVEMTVSRKFSRAQYGMKSCK
jgi:hypothetical protein